MPKTKNEEEKVISTPEGEGNISNNATDVEVADVDSDVLLPEVKVKGNRPKGANAFPVNNEPTVNPINVDTSRIPIADGTPTTEEDVENESESESENESEGTPQNETPETENTAETASVVNAEAENETPEEEAETPEEEEKGFYERFFNETEEERQKREKKERRNKRIAAAGDIVSALANLYFTHKGGLNTYDKNNTLYGHLEKRYKEAAEEREKNRKNYWDAYVKDQQLKNAARKEEREDRKQAAAEVINEKKYEIERTRADYANAVNEARARLYNANADKAEVDRQIKEIDAEFEEKLKQLDIELKEARALYQTALASATTTNAQNNTRRTEQNIKESESRIDKNKQTGTDNGSKKKTGMKSLDGNVNANANAKKSLNI